MMKQRSISIQLQILIDSDIFAYLPAAERTEKIKSLLLDHKDLPPTITMNEVGEYGLHELILYIDAQIYLKRPRRKDQPIFNRVW